MNYVQSNRTLFVVPRGVKLNKTKESEKLHNDRKALKNSIDQQKSTQSKVVFKVDLNTK